MSDPTPQNAAKISPHRCWQALAALREAQPLVHNITNYVVMNSTANALLALGASPVMAHAENEVAEMVALAGALAVNLGTLSDRWIAAMHKAIAAAGETGTPVVLDPVGAGATAYRTDTARSLLEAGPIAVVRGNASEIAALAAAGGDTRGVDSTRSPAAVADLARELARRYGCAVAVSGPQDWILRVPSEASGGAGETAIVANGDPMMARVTGTGCTATAIVGAFLAVEPDPFWAATYGMAVLGVAGELAANAARGPGSFQPALLDALYHLDETAIAARLSVSQVGAPEAEAEG